MAFYVPVGFRGAIFRFGTFWIGLSAFWVYRRASSRRAVILAAEPVKPG